MPMNLTQYWTALEQDIARLQQRYNYQDYEPITAALGMAEAGKGIELASGFTWMTQLLAIERTIKEREQGIGDRLPEQDIYLPRIHTPLDFLFAIIYLRHQLRFADVVVASGLINGGVQSRKPTIAAVAEQLSQRINAWYEENAEAVEDALPGIATAPGDTLLERVESLLRPQPQFESRMAQTIQQEFNLIIEQGVDAADIVTALRHHFAAKQQIITKMYATRQLLDALAEAEVSMATIDPNLLNSFTRHLNEEEQAHWQAALIPPSVEELRAQATGILPSSSRAISGVWSWLTWATEGLGHLIEPVIWSPLSSATKVLYGGGVYIAESLGSTAQALLVKPAATTPREEVARTVASSIFDATARQLITDANGLTLEMAREASADELLRLKDKLTVLNTVLVLDKQMDAFIQTHNQGIVKFTDFFRPINQFLSKTFFRYIMHDKTLLLEEARQFKIALTEIKEELEVAETPNAIKQRLINEAERKRSAITSVSRNSRYVFINNNHKQDALQAAQHLEQLVEDARTVVAAT